MDHLDIKYLLTSIEIAKMATEHGNHPFGALLVDENNNVLLRVENTVITDRDATGHAETNLVRQASKEYSAEQLTRCTLYSSTEPCAMCAGAIHWSGIGRVVYALSEEDLYEIVGKSPENLLLPCRDIFRHSQKTTVISGPCTELVVEARAVHEEFWHKPDISIIDK